MHVRSVQKLNIGFISTAGNADEINPPRESGVAHVDFVSISAWEVKWNNVQCRKRDQLVLLHSFKKVLS